MRFSSILAIYSLFWSMSFFFVLPFRLKVDDAQEAYVPGQAESAPPRFSFARTCFWTTIVGAVLFTIFYANWAYGWIEPNVLDFLWKGRG